MSAKEDDKLVGSPASVHDDEKPSAVPSPQPAPAPKRASVLDRLPPWIGANLRSPASRKKWLRCWIASWVCFVILLPNASLRTLGNAAFFALLASVLVPSHMPVQLFIYLIATIIVGMCLGWAFGAAAMKAALSSRNQLLLKASLEKEMQSAAGLANPDALFVSDIFAGKFLDTRSSVVYGCFLGLGCFFFALIRAYAPQLTLMSVFGSIAIDLFCSYGPLFPFAQYTLLNTLLTSTACYAAIGIVLITLVFPESVNHAALVSVSGLVGNLKKIVDMQQKILDASPEELVPGTPLTNGLAAARAGIVAQMQGLVASTKFIGIEFSWGKWNASDVTGLQDPLVAVVSRSAALHSFGKLVGRHSLYETGQSAAPSAAASEISEDASLISDGYLLRQLRERNTVVEAKYNVRMKDILPLIEEATSDLRGAVSDGLAAAKALLDGINTRRWHRKGDRESQQQLEDLDRALERLRSSLADFQESRRLLLLRPFEPLFESAKVRKKGPIPFRTLFISFVFAANMIAVAQVVDQFLVYVQTVAAKRTKNRLWAPGGLRAIAKALMAKGEASDQAAGEDTEGPAEQQGRNEEVPYRRDPDSSPPTNPLQHVANGIHHIYKWTKTPEALFVFRYVFLSVALWIPQVCKSSAHFIYVEKGLWSLIMAQTTLNIYASDQMFNLIMRIGGTFFGAILGLLTWYIGSAHGHGNPYSDAVVVAVFLIPIIFFRLFTPPQYLPGLLLLCATWVLVVGYSWINGHLVIVGNPGIGWPVAYKRLITVLIGSAASFIMMMLPPKSGRKAVRLKNANILMQLSSLYSDITAAWISSDGVPDSDLAKSAKQWNPAVRAKVISIATQLQALRVQTAMAKWEGNIRGVWPMGEYMKLIEVETDIMASLALLGGALVQLQNDTRLRFLQHTLVVNPNFISDVIATFSLVSQSLRTAEPLPQAFNQNLLDRLLYHGQVQQGGRHASAEAHEETHRTHLESVSQYEYVFYACAVSAVFQILEGLNEARAIAIRLCGEVPLEGWARWKHEYERSHIAI